MTGKRENENDSWGVHPQDPRFARRQNDFTAKRDTKLLAIGDWKLLTAKTEKIYKETLAAENKGHVADYIPQLADVDDNLFGVTIVSVDGQVFHIGDDPAFCVQSCSKPVTYGIALEQFGEDVVHNFIGMEPSGRNFNELCLNSDDLPHNPLINAGSIMAASLIHNDTDPSERFDFVYKFWRKLVADTYLSFDNSVYLSEKATADRNYCLGYMMQERQAFQRGKSAAVAASAGRSWHGSSLGKSLELYFQICSIKTELLGAGLLAATLANGGVQPWTHEKLFDYSNVKRITSLMLSCGMYDYSGEWCYKIGIPAKSGVSGLVYGVIPGLCGIACYSPKLDEIGNSYRGVQFFRRFVDDFNVHVFDNRHNSRKISLERRTQTDKNINGFLLLDAASKNDCDLIKDLLSKGVDVNYQDYDKRTPLHLAENNGCAEAAEMLRAAGANPRIKDRWGDSAAPKKIASAKTSAKKSAAKKKKK